MLRITITMPIAFMIFLSTKIMAEENCSSPNLSQIEIEEALNRITRSLITAPGTDPAAVNGFQNALKSLAESNPLAALAVVNASETNLTIFYDPTKSPGFNPSTYSAMIGNADWPSGGNLYERKASVAAHELAHALHDRIGGSLFDSIYKSDTSRAAYELHANIAGFKGLSTTGLTDDILRLAYAETINGGYRPSYQFRDATQNMKTPEKAKTLLYLAGIGGPNAALYDSSESIHSAMQESLKGGLDRSHLVWPGGIPGIKHLAKDVAKKLAEYGAKAIPVVGIGFGIYELLNGQYCQAALSFAGEAPGVGILVDLGAFGAEVISASIEAGKIRSDGIEEQAAHLRSLLFGHYCRGELPREINKILTSMKVVCTQEIELVLALQELQAMYGQPTINSYRELELLDKLLRSIQDSLNRIPPEIQCFATSGNRRAARSSGARGTRDSSLIPLLPWAIEPSYKRCLHTQPHSDGIAF